MEKQEFYISDSAARRILTLAAETNKGIPLLRISVSGGGCSGFRYQYEMVQTQEEEDIVFEKHQVKVLIDPVSLNFIAGSQLDFIEELIGSYFTLKNPQARASCGCGSSFSI
jgi:iron-sulfur cluster insertion protein